VVESAEVVSGMHHMNGNLLSIWCVMSKAWGSYDHFTWSWVFPLTNNTYRETRAL